MDEGDYARDYQERLNREALENRPRPSKGESATECEDCGDEIPEKRRQAVPGCVRCIHCQQEFERRLKSG